MISKVELKRILNSFGVNIRSVENMLGVLDKMHKNVNAIEFAKMLFGLGMKQTQVENILRRVGVDDLAYHVSSRHALILYI